ncbi:hypothetical protein PMG11_11141 [Penicillium brasilianum]|uniref:Uncharacterized protein n=1 Tax=Penicillium brasilianum TaxID=104259 RepID=A0A0F7U327_PENBI|nr:hypothetical protein PMG11_11141 [Penicillium brasilianum]
MLGCSCAWPHLSAATPDSPVQKCLAPEPGLPVQHLAPSMALAACIVGPSGHWREPSQPSNNFYSLWLLTQDTHLPQAAASNTSSPMSESYSTRSTPEFHPTPNTPLSPAALDTGSWCRGEPREVGL